MYNVMYNMNVHNHLFNHIHTLYTMQNCTFSIYIGPQHGRHPTYNTKKKASVVHHVD